mmetsp:Transcript_25665/g.35723  ORF Transcript_25665/g.35723 Transcript_25665/m.35723 type:complete len:398 (+) Transcript_25665:96-1289(+)
MWIKTTSAIGFLFVVIFGVLFVERQPKDSAWNETTQGLQELSSNTRGAGNHHSNYKRVADTAICIFGREHALEFTGETIRNHVIDAWDPDIFLSLSANVENLDYRQLNVSEISVFREFEVQRFNSSWNATEWFENLPMNDRQRDEFHNILQTHGSHFCGPLPNCVKGGAYQMHHLHQCEEMISEAESRRGIRYRYVYTFRTDSYHRANIPNPSLLNFTDNKCYIQCSDADYKGYCDNGAMCSREAAMSYHGMARAMTRGSIRFMRSINALKYSVKARHLHPEIALKALLDMHGLEIERLPDVSFLTCGPCAPDERGEMQCERHNACAQCRWDAEEGRGVRAYGAMRKIVSKSRIHASYLEQCGWSKDFIQYFQHTNMIESLVSRNECLQIDGPEVKI